MRYGGVVEAVIDDSDLVVLAQQGHAEAFGTLVERYSPAAYRIAVQLVNDHNEAEDIAQDALLSVWRQLPKFRAEAAFSTWLYRVVTNLALNRLTRGRHRDTVEVPSTFPATGDGPAEGTFRKQAGEAVTAAVAALPSAQRIAVVLHHFEGLSYADVAAITESTVPAVRSHLFRARRTLATTLEQWR